MTRQVLVLQHGPQVPLGSFATVTATVPHHVVRLYLDESVPADHREWAGIVSLGGEMGAYETDRFPFPAAEKTLMATATEAGTPVLGVCLGAQLLSAATGGRAYRAPTTTAEMVRFLPCGDPLVDTLVAPQLAFHHDTFDVPPHASLLQSSDRYPLAFRVGRSVGIQTHPEIDGDVLIEWLSLSVGRDTISESGRDSDELVAQMRATESETVQSARDFFAAWVDGLYVD